MIIVERKEADVSALARMDVDPAAREDDGKDWTGVVVTKPWGFEREIHRAGMVSIWRLWLNAGCETSLHCHVYKRTELVVERGVVVLETLSGHHVLHGGEAANIAPGVFHRSKSVCGAVLIEIETPPNKNDIVRYQDKYGREGRPYQPDLPPVSK